MALQIKLEDVIEALELASFEMSYFLDKRTGEVFSLTSEQLRAAEEEESLDRYPDWMHSGIQIAVDMLDNEDQFIALPSQVDFDEYRVMEAFSSAVEAQKASDALWAALQGKGAFRRFKQCLERYCLRDEWFAHKDRALRRTAIEWCEARKLDWH